MTDVRLPEIHAIIREVEEEKLFWHYVSTAYHYSVPLLIPAWRSYWRESLKQWLAEERETTNPSLWREAILQSWKVTSLSLEKSMKMKENDEEVSPSWEAEEKPLKRLRREKGLYLLLEKLSEEKQRSPSMQPDLSEKKREEEKLCQKREAIYLCVILQCERNDEREREEAEKYFMSETCDWE